MMKKSEIKKVQSWLKDKDQKLAVICDMDKYDNEYNHEFYLTPVTDDDPVYMAEKLRIRELRDVSVGFLDLKEAMELGFEGLHSCFNYSGR